MKPLCLLALVLAACAHPAPRSSAPTTRPAVEAIQALPDGPATAVVALDPDVPTAVARGPFLITTINPGGDLALGLATRACDEPGLLWFGYSGSGVAVGAGQMLCARSGRGERQVQAFSGRTGGTSTTPP